MLRETGLYFRVLYLEIFPEVMEKVYLDPVAYKTVWLI